MTSHYQALTIIVLLNHNSK